MQRIKNNTPQPTLPVQKQITDAKNNVPVIILIFLAACRTNPITILSPIQTAAAAPTIAEESHDFSKVIFGP
jgi:hypothetical protein